MAKPDSNLVISPSDDDTSEIDEFADFLFTNEVIQVNAIDEYTQLISVSLTNKRKYHQIHLNIPIYYINI